MTLKPLKKKKGIIFTEDNIYEKQYKNWKSNMDKEKLNGKFFILYKDFEMHLKDISSGALKLFLYYGFHAKNDTGLSYHSIERCSQYFGVSEKTINNWNKELLSRGLIYRKSKGSKLNKNTYLLPFSMNLMTIQNSEIESLINNEVFEEAFGKAIKAFHLFQFRRSSDSKEFNIPYNTIVVVYEKIYMPISSSYNKTPKPIHHLTAMEFKLKDTIYKDIKINNTNLNDSIHLFETPIDFKEYIPNINVDVQGIFVKANINIDTSFKENLKNMHWLISELIDEDTDLNAYKNIDLLTTESLEE